MTGVAILMYHSIAASPRRSRSRLEVDPSLFDEHLTALCEVGVRLIPVRAVSAVLAASEPGEGTPCAAVTIDDGFADSATNAAPALAARAVAATLFIPTRYVGGSAAWLAGDAGRRRMLSWQDIADLAAAGLEIGSHGHCHLPADVIPAALVREDAVRSRMILEHRLGGEVESYAYPFGYAPPSARSAIRRAGFGQACSVADLPAQPRDDRFALPRLAVTQQTTPEMLLSLVRDRPSPVARTWAHAKQRVWTEGRRLTAMRRGPRMGWTRS